MKVFVFSSLIICFSFCCCIQSLSQVIVVNNSKQSNGEFLLAAFENDGIVGLKSIQSDENGFALFSMDSLKSGLYYIVFPDSSSIEFILEINFTSKISISLDTITGKFSVRGSGLTEAYNNFLNELEQITNEPTSNIVRSFYIEGSKSKKGQINTLIDKYVNLFPSSILEAYLSALKNIEIPPYNPPVEVVKKDSAVWQYQLSYFQGHYLDNLYLSDIRLTRTPVYTDLINKYLDKIVRQNPQSLSEGIDFLIYKSSSRPEAQEYMVRYLLNKYDSKKNNAISEYLLLYIIDKYIFKAECTWISDGELLSITKEYNKRNPASLLQKAPEIEMSDVNGELKKLYDIESDNTIIYFYSYDCAVCNKVTPDLRKVLSKFDYLKVKVYAVSTGNNAEEWQKYIVKNNIGNWTNVSDATKINDVVRNYNLTLTPTIFLLDKNKVIISKNITVAQFHDFLLKEALNQNKR